MARPSPALYVTSSQTQTDGVFGTDAHDWFIEQIFRELRERSLMAECCSLVLFLGMNPEQKKFLQKRFRSAVASQPELKSLKLLLLKLGGEMLVAPGGPDADVPALVQQGFCMSGAVCLKVMERNGCHKNVASVWRHQRFGVVGIATGYALQTDGLWRQHSWGVLRDGILETTVENSKYFGILLQGESADRFVALNSV